MDLKSALLQEHSKAQSLRIAAYIGAQPEQFAGLMHLFLSADYCITQRAAWVVSICADHNPQLLQPYLREMIMNLKRPVQDAVKRHTMRVLESQEIPDGLQGCLVDICFDFLTNNEPAAIKAYAQTVLLNLVKKEPELKNELRLVIEDQLSYASPAFVSRARKTLAALKKLT